MIYSASRRTDMPAFFPDAIAKRVRRSRKLDGIVFWTKDVRNLVGHPDLRDIVKSIPTIIQYTVTGLAGTAWEPNVAGLETQLPALADLAALLPTGAVRWRFDPILPGADLAGRFTEIKERLESVLASLDGVTVSFPDPYRKAVGRAKAAGLAWPQISMVEKRDIVAMMAAAFTEGNGQPVKLCCEPELLALAGTGKARCIDGGLFERLYGLPLGELGKDPGQRAACGCVKSTDIGSYDMRCPHRCLYCYASPGESPSCTVNFENVDGNFPKHSTMRIS